MTETKQKRKRITTAAYPGLWCWLLTPDTRFDGDGVYSVDLVMPKEAARDLCKQCAEQVAEQANQIKTANVNVRDWRLVWPAKDCEEEGYEGQMAVSFKQKIKPPHNFTVDVFDAKKNQLAAGSVRIGNGTKLRICFSPRVAVDQMNKCLRVMFHPSAAQIIELVKWEADYGFEETEGFAATNGDEHPDFNADSPVAGMRERAKANQPTTGEFDPDGSGIPIDDLPF